MLVAVLLRYLSEKFTRTEYVGFCRTNSGAVTDKDIHSLE